MSRQILNETDERHAGSPGGGGVAVAASAAESLLLLVCVGFLLLTLVILILNPKNATMKKTVVSEKGRKE